MNCDVIAQDKIVLNNGDTIDALVQKVGQPEIEYKRWDNKQGPLYTLRRFQINRIIYQNGTTDVFKNGGIASDTTLAISRKGWDSTFTDMTEVDLVRLGEIHARKHYKPGWNFAAGFACGLAGNVLGAIGPAIIKEKSIKSHNLLYPYEYLWSDPAYQLGYLNEAQKRKKIHLWTGWAAGVGGQIAVIVVANVIYNANNPYY